MRTVTREIFVFIRSVQEADSVYEYTTRQSIAL